MEKIMIAKTTKDENEKIVCPSCEGEEQDPKCTRCEGTGEVFAVPRPTNRRVIPKSTSIVPIQIAKRERKKFKAWKQELIGMIRRDSEIEWSRTPQGQYVARFILPAELCKIVYEVQIKERIAAQLQHATEHFKAKGRAMPPREEITKLAVATLQQEFMQNVLATLQGTVPAHATALQPPIEPGKPSEESEQRAAEDLSKMREELVSGKLATKVCKVESLEAGIKAELAKREEDDTTT